MSVATNQKEWEDLGELDPYWAVLTSKEKKYGNWQKAQFFETGKGEIDQFIKKALKLGYPKQFQTALDFGCGLGRVTQALAGHFTKVYGVDIALPMVDKAKRLHKSVKNCQFIHNPKDNLAIFKNDMFDCVYSKITLQHIPSTKSIENYITEFTRILKPNGLLVFQVPSHMPLRYKIQYKRRIYTTLRYLGFSKETLYNRLGLFPMRMNALSEDKIKKILAISQVSVLKIEHDSWAGTDIPSRTYFVTKKK